MAKFLVLYHAPTPAREMMASATPEEMQEGMDAWMGWAKQNEGAIVDLGAPLGDSTSVGSGGGGDVTGYSVVEADSKDAAAALFDDHPHLHMQSGAWIELLEFMPLPGT